MDKKVLISVGPIPGRLDSVKYITNRFKGGLALKTAKLLVEKGGFDVKVVAWTHTDVGDWEGTVVRVDDVFEYYDLIEACAKEQKLDAFIMAAAVANLVPKEPWEGKFPSHNYEVGDEINIPFTIAPRSIDIVKKHHPRCTLIGYKLFDGTEEELVRAAKHTLKESKANIIFANTPKDAKTKKIALTQSDAQIPMSFHEHVEFIAEAINARYYRTRIYDVPHQFDEHVESPITLKNPYWGEKAIECFQRSRKHGSLAIRREDGVSTTSSSIMISGRGHQGVPTVFSASHHGEEDLVVWTTKKASANAPLVWNFMRERGYDVVLHEHSFLQDVPTYKYVLPGTALESGLWGVCDTNAFNIEHHGFLAGYKLMQTDWDKYYELYPHRFFKIPDFIYKAIADTVDGPILDVGCNKRPVKRATHVCDLSVEVPGHGRPGMGTNLSWTHLEKKSKFFELIVLGNSINYISANQLKILIAALKRGGKLVANSFRALESSKMTDNGIAVLGRGNKLVHHALFLDNGVCMEHTFYNSDIQYWLSLGFKIEPYGENSLRLEYTKP